MGAPMPTERSTDCLEFGRVEGHEVVACFDGGAITSDAGALLLGHTDRALRLVERLADCFVDQRRAGHVEHSVATLVGQRVFALALGYEDLNDHDHLRHDPLFATLAGKLEARRKQCAPVAGKSTLNRLELSQPQATRYHKISYDGARLETLFVDLFLEAHPSPPQEIILDLDATDDPLHGDQEGRFFHGFHGSYCYLPLYIFCGRDLLVAKLRRANIDAAAGSVEEVERITTRIRTRWPGVRIILRADSGFAREQLMAWCEHNGVDYVLGLARNKVLTKAISAQMAEAAQQSHETGKPARRFADFTYRTRNSWSGERRVVGKAEWISPSAAELAQGTTAQAPLPGRANPRFIVTSLGADRYPPAALYEKTYCARGEMENRIKECQLDLFADRTSSHTMRANQLRLWLASMAYVLLNGLRRIGLVATALCDASCGSIRLKLLKIGARVTISVRRIKFSMASAYPYTDIFRTACAALTRAAA